MAKFLSTPSARRATGLRRRCALRFRFLSTPSARRATSGCCTLWSSRTDFYPRPPRGGRRERQQHDQAAASISIHALREEGDAVPPGTAVVIPKISIHALREEGDVQRAVQGCAGQTISIHALREEGDRTRCRSRRHRRYFYPRPPRGGRRGQLGRQVGAIAISIHALREEGDMQAYDMDMFKAISIHALREEGDHGRAGHGDVPQDFYPRPPRGGRPCDGQHGAGRRAISIHALREEGDSSLSRCCTAFRNFYPRPPRGGRLVVAPFSIVFCVFLSTPSARRATPTRPRRRRKSMYFYPRPPRGGRLTSCQSRSKTSDFYPRPPRGGRPSAFRPE